MSVCRSVDSAAGAVATAAVSYVGRANLGETAEKYIRDFHLWTNGRGNCIVIEISAMGGKFVLDFLQPFANPVYLNSFLRELDENGISYDLQSVMRWETPDVHFPWLTK